MRHRSSVFRPALHRKAIVGLGAFFTIALLPCGVALANTVTTNFEAPLFKVCTPPAPVFAAMCTVNGQDGWKAGLPGEIGPGLPIGYDQQVVANSGAPPEFGGQSLRLSNGYTEATNNFFAQTYSKPAVKAGEGLANTEYIGQFSFISTSPHAQQPGLNISVSPDDAQGGRMSYVELADVNTTENGVTDNGIDVIFYDTKPNGEFVGYNLGILPRDVPHTITFWMKLNDGPSNDLVRIYIDGKDVGQCFTTWENYYRAPSPIGENRKPPFSDTLQFRSSGNGVTIPNLVGHGYLFDNVKIKTSDGPGPPGCDVPIDKLPGAPVISAGGLASYRIIAHNRGRLTERNLMLCDRIPREATFVRANRRLRRLGRRRCLFIPSLRPGQRSSFRIVLRVNANAHPGTLDNTAEETPVQPPDLPPPSTVLPPGLTVPDVPGMVTDTPPPIENAAAPVKVVAKPSAPAPTPPPPTVTG